MNKKPAEEFTFLGTGLRRIAELLISGEKKDIVEAVFLIGCLHNICYENSQLFSEKDENSPQSD
jgi:hypothetical protein